MKLGELIHIDGIRASSATSAAEGTSESTWPMAPFAWSIPRSGVQRID